MDQKDSERKKIYPLLDEHSKQVYWFGILFFEITILPLLIAIFISR